jgi:hypothetical protein
MSFEFEHEFCALADHERPPSGSSNTFKIISPDPVTFSPTIRSPSP